ncbi:hypothetical protein GPECTOR_2g1094 [Gonium pectorale]|uniref:Uncharacterized protein n=1 Tax=Gonium pectorale TaxID=33097 RepID=A0A150H0E4_GONPE|nr:hypothetical protein GPECTOR_2g1094 [Gonium pectorale]|eukprot:KXZ55545.1 hypothetical protein GPECTOR_2g1094 [Gonium pectorale]
MPALFAAATARYISWDLAGSGERILRCVAQRERGLLISGYPCASGLPTQVLHILAYLPFYAWSRPLKMRDWAWLATAAMHLLMLALVWSLALSSRRSPLWAWWLRRRELVLLAYIPLCRSVLHYAAYALMPRHRWRDSSHYALYTISACTRPLTDMLLQCIYDTMMKVLLHPGTYEDYSHRLAASSASLLSAIAAPTAGLATGSAPASVHALLLDSPEPQFLRLLVLSAAGCVDRSCSEGGVGEGGGCKEVVLAEMPVLLAAGMQVLRLELGPVLMRWEQEAGLHATAAIALGFASVHHPRHGRLDCGGSVHTPPHALPVAPREVSALAAADANPPAAPVASCAPGNCALPGLLLQRAALVAHPFRPLFEARHGGGSSAGKEYERCFRAWRAAALACGARCRVCLVLLPLLLGSLRTLTSGEHHAVRKILGGLPFCLSDALGHAALELYLYFASSSRQAVESAPAAARASSGAAAPGAATAAAAASAVSIAAAGYAAVAGEAASEFVRIHCRALSAYNWMAAVAAPLLFAVGAVCLTRGISLPNDGFVDNTRTAVFMLIFRGVLQPLLVEMDVRGALLASVLYAYGEAGLLSVVMARWSVRTLTAAVCCMRASSCAVAAALERRARRRFAREVRLAPAALPKKNM